MHPDAQQVLQNASVRDPRTYWPKRKPKFVRKAKEANAVREEPEGKRHKKDPWNTLWKDADMRLHLSDAARETLRRMKKNG